MAAGADEKWTIDKLDGTNWSIPKNYSTLVTALEAQDNISLDYVQQALVLEELKLLGQVKRFGTNER